MSAPLLQELERGFAGLPVAQVDAGSLGAARRAQLAAALADGLPGARAERWRHTSLRALERRAFSPLPAPAPVDADVVAAIPGPRLVFVNGTFSPALSLLDGAPDGVELTTLALALARGDAREVDFLARRFDAADETFARLNAAFALDGLLLRVADGVRCTAPIALVMLGAGSGGDHAVHLRHCVELGKDAELTLCEYQLAASPQKHLVNSLSQLHLRRGACLNHVRVQAEDTGTTLFARSDVALAGAAVYRRVDLELGAALSRHELNVALQGDGARVHAAGVLFADGRRHVDTRLNIEHVARDTACELNWRGLAADRGRVVFHGGIRIRAGADGTSAQLSNKNLLLSPNAEIDTQPVLEIHADEVQASHGATVGQLDDAALFYLRSRGVPQIEARTLLTLAFCRVVLDGIGDPDLRERMDALLSARLPPVSA